MKSKIVIILVVLSITVLGAGVTYSYFVANKNGSTGTNDIAKFIFNNTVSDSLNIPLLDFKPGDIKTYDFKISNSDEELDKTSDVTIDYELTILTPHYIPLIIELYKEDTLLMTCDESKTRNANNELVCKTPIQELIYEEESEDNYQLKVTFDSNYNTEEYANLIDYINIEIKSYQKV